MGCKDEYSRIERNLNTPEKNVNFAESNVYTHMFQNWPWALVINLSEFQPAIKIAQRDLYCLINPEDGMGMILLAHWLYHVKNSTFGSQHHTCGKSNVAEWKKTE